MKRVIALILGVLQIVLIGAAVVVAAHTQWRLNPGPARATLDYGLRWYAVAVCLLILGVALRTFPERLPLPRREADDSRPTKRRIWLSLIVLPAGLALVGFALYRVFQQHDAVREWGLLLSGFALVGFAWASLFRQQGREQAPQEEKAKTEEAAAQSEQPQEIEPQTGQKESKLPRRFSLWLHLLVILVAVIPAFRLGLYAGRMWYEEQHPGLAFLPWGGAMLLCVLALGWVDWRNGWRPFRKVNWPAWWEWLILLAIMVMAAHFRIDRLSEIPEGIWFDEAQFGRESQRILAEHPPYSPVATFSHNPSLSFYVTAVFFHFLGDTVFALRLPIVVWGLVGIFALFFLARLLFGRVAAIAAALLMAAMYWHVVFCRFNMTNLISPTCAVVGLYLFFRGEHTGRLLDYFASGFFQSLSLHGYQPAAFLILAFGVVAIHRFFMHRGRFRIAYVGKLLLVALAGFLVFVPLGAYAKKHPQQVSRRMRETALWKAYVSPDGSIDRTGLMKEVTDPNSWMRDKLRYNMWKHVLFFNYTGDWIKRHGVPFLPRVDRVTGALFVLGMALACFHARQSRYFLLIAWWFCGLLPGILTLPFEAPQSARTVIAIPGIALLAAVPVSTVGSILANRWNMGPMLETVGRFLRTCFRWAFSLVLRRRLEWSGVPGKLRSVLAIPVGAFFSALWACFQYAGNIVLVVLLMSLAVYVTRENYHLYFGVHQKRPDVWQAYMGRETMVARVIVDLPQDWLLYQQNRGAEPSRFLGAQPPNDRYFIPYRDLPPSDLHHNDIVYVLENDRNPLPGEHWMATFGVGEFKQFVNEFQEPVCFSFHIGAATLESLKSIHALYRSADRSIPEHAINQPTLFLLPSDEWAGYKTPFSFRWSGMVYAPRTGVFRFRWNPALDAEVKIDSRPVDTSGTSPVQLACGWHNFEAGGSLPAPRQSRIEWQIAGTGSFSPVERRYLFARMLPPHGLLGFYYPTPMWAGDPVFRQIDPVVDFRWRPLTPGLRPDWSARWIGYLAVHEPGSYFFQLEGPSPVVVRIDGNDVIDTHRGGRKFGTINLSAGEHPIDIWYRRGAPNYPHRFELYWRPPGKGNRTLIPYRSFIPECARPAEGSPFSMTPPGR